LLKSVGFGLQTLWQTGCISCAGMNDREGVEFLQWCLPRLKLRWPGFRKVRRQVYKRIDRRVKELGMPSVGAYRAYLEDHSDEWAVLDALCRIFISRFYRDKAVFECLDRGAFVIGSTESLPAGTTGFEPWSAGLRVYRRSERTARP
jgi:chemotaxis protein methyltransferase CheR